MSEFFLLEDASIQLIDGDRGKNYPKQSDYLQEGECLFLSAKNVTKNGFAFDEQTFISGEKDSQLRAGKLQRQDIVVTTRGTIGNVAYYDNSVPFDDIRINSGMLIFRANPNIWNRRFLATLLDSSIFQNQVLAITSGSAVPQLPARDIKKFNLPKISLEKQEDIIKVIGDLDDKIELNRKINANLEAIAQAIFKSWFVDFDPVHAKARGEKPKGMDAETAALFPSEFVDSELGMIPKGWEVKRLSEIASFQNGYAFKSKDWQETGIPVVKIGSVKPGYIDVLNSNSSYISSELAMKTDNRFKLKEGDILVGMTGYPGQVGLVPHCSTPIFLNQRVGRFDPNTNFYSYLYVCCRTDEFKQHVDQNAQGSAQANISSKSIMEHKIIVSEQPIIEIFEKIIHPKILGILKNYREIEMLKMTRDNLLPRLLSGEIAVD